MTLSLAAPRIGAPWIVGRSVKVLMIIAIVFGLVSNRWDNYSGNHAHTGAPTLSHQHLAAEPGRVTSGSRQGWG